jgi:hypothetical protein
MTQQQPAPQLPFAQWRRQVIDYAKKRLAVESDDDVTWLIGGEQDLFDNYPEWHDDPEAYVDENVDAAL